MLQPQCTPSCSSSSKVCRQQLQTPRRGGAALTRHPYKPGGGAGGNIIRLTDVSELLRCLSSSSSYCGIPGTHVLWLERKEPCLSIKLKLQPYKKHQATLLYTCIKTTVIIPQINIVIGKMLVSMNLSIQIYQFRAYREAKCWSWISKVLDAA